MSCLRSRLPSGVLGAAALLGSLVRAPSVFAVAALRALSLYEQTRLFGIGPDLTMAIFQHGGTLGLVNVRYLWESGGKRSFQGSTFVAGVTIAKPRVN